MSDNEGGLIDPELKRALQHPAVKKMASEFSEMKASLENVRSMLEQLPEAIGRAVTASMTDAAIRQPPPGASGPPVELRGGPDMAFAPGGKVSIAGREEKAAVAGLHQILSVVGENVPESDIESWTTRQRQQVFAWARAMYLKTTRKNMRVPRRPSVLGGKS